MRIGVIGTPESHKELVEKLGSKCEIVRVKDKNFDELEAVFDLSANPELPAFESYARLNIPVVVNAVNIQLEAVLAAKGLKNSGNLFGINALPGFIGLEKWECSSISANFRPTMESLAAKLGVKILWVESRVGMVTPRILFMIINEAFYTVQEGTASKEHINTGMKLGTNYPGGPFEWVDKIGIANVYNALQSLYSDTGDERYKICPLLKTEYLKVGV